jgi:hypothetical protein
MKVPLTVNIPTFGTGPAQGPTGQVSNSNISSFPVIGGNGLAADFIFVNLNGTISAWDGGPTAFIQVTPIAGIPTSYSGLAINQGQTLLYAANDAGAGSVNLFNSKFGPASLPPEHSIRRRRSAPAGSFPSMLKILAGACMSFTRPPVVRPFRRIQR